MSNNIVMTKNIFGTYVYKTPNKKEKKWYFHKSFIVQISGFLLLLLGIGTILSPVWGMPDIFIIWGSGIGFFSIIPMVVGKLIYD